MAGRSMCRAMPMLAAISLVLCGCATPGKETKQTVRIETPGCALANCELSNDRGHWRVSPAPGNVELTTSRQPLEVRCNAGGGVLGRGSAGSSTASNTGAGVIAGGVAGGAVGAAAGAAALAFIPPLGVIIVLSSVAAGAATGDVIESSQGVLRYPDLITVPMHCAPPAILSTARTAGAAWGLGIRGLLPAATREAGAGERSAVLVTSVLAEGAAATAGLRAGDVIVAADGQALVDAADFEVRLLALPPGTSLELRVWRDGQWVNVRATRVALAP